jgi:hypothetical protein
VFSKLVKAFPFRSKRFDSIKNSSIVHWSHINFFGTYDFTQIDKKVNDMIS